MTVCVSCKKEMVCAKTGVGVDFGNGHVYAGDRFLCPACGQQVVVTVAAPHYDPEYKHHGEFVRMEAK